MDLMSKVENNKGTRPKNLGNELQIEEQITNDVLQILENEGEKRPRIDESRSESNKKSKAESSESDEEDYFYHY